MGCAAFCDHSDSVPTFVTTSVVSAPSGNLAVLWNVSVPAVFRNVPARRVL